VFTIGLIYLYELKTKRISAKFPISPYLIIIPTIVIMSSYRIYYNVIHYYPNFLKSEAAPLSFLDLVNSVIPYYDAPFPRLIWDIWSIVSASELSLFILVNVIIGITSIVIYRETKNLYAFLFYQIGALTFTLTHLIGIVDDFIGLLFFILTVFSFEKYNQPTKRTYLFILLTILSHKTPTFILFTYLLYRRSYRSTAFLTSILSFGLLTSTLGYGEKFGQIGGLILEPFYITSWSTWESFNYGYFTLIVTVQALWIGLYYISKNKKGLPIFCIFGALPFILPINTVDHSLVWRIFWMTIVFIPLMFYGANNSKVNTNKIQCSNNPIN
jgi:hypothetical protein